MSEKAQVRLKIFLSVAITYVGMTTVWGAINGHFSHILGQFGIALLSLILGNLIGRILKIQRGINRLAQLAQARLKSPTDGAHRSFASGFVTCTLLFCVGPMAILGSLQDGLSGQIKLLVTKSVLDGISAMAFARSMGPGVLLSAVPVFLYQGTITLGAKYLQPVLDRQNLVDSISLAGGMLILCIPLILFDIRKVPLGDYLPCLVVAPILTHFIG
jgi:uncharacterized membrane protein YqgA involved in biofilm formation